MGLSIEGSSGPFALAPVGLPKLAIDPPGTALGPALPPSFALGSEASSSFNQVGVVSYPSIIGCGRLAPNGLDAITATAKVLSLC